MKKMLLTLIITAICLATVAAGTKLTYQWQQNLGPEITISLSEAKGLIPDQSKIMYKGVQVGSINSITLDTKSKHALVVARINKQFAELLGSKSKFWIVYPNVGLNKISNLGTIATGNYIEVEPIAGKFASQFIGLDIAPINPLVASGRRLILSASILEGITLDSPILYRGFKIGEIISMNLSKDRMHVDMLTYIYREYADVIRAGSYFANISGIHAGLSLFGTSHLDMDSAITMVKGGIAVYTPNFSAAESKNGDVFKVLTTKQWRELKDS